MNKQTLRLRLIEGLNKALETNRITMFTYVEMYYQIS